MKYIVEVELGQKANECAYSALIPELPGCFTTGESFEELKANIQEAVEGWIECANEEGENRPMPTGYIIRFHEIEIAV